MKQDLFFENEYSLPMLVRGDVKVEWINLGEGSDGDYDYLDPEDVNLLRFEVAVCKNGDWETIEDGSYCTQVPATATTSELKKLLVFFMNELYDSVSTHGKAKRICESLSWVAAVDA